VELKQGCFVVMDICLGVELEAVRNRSTSLLDYGTYNGDK